MGATPPLSGQMPESAHPPAMGALPPQYCAAPVCRTFVFFTTTKTTRATVTSAGCAWMMVLTSSAGSNRLNQINPYSILSPFRKSKTSDFFEVNIRTFDAKPPDFCPKKSDVLQPPDHCLFYPSPQKSSLKISL